MLVSECMVRMNCVHSRGVQCRGVHLALAQYNSFLVLLTCPFTWHMQTAEGCVRVDIVIELVLRTTVIGQFARISCVMS